VIRCWPLGGGVASRAAGLVAAPRLLAAPVLSALLPWLLQLW
jgi:hypothetical protein